MERKNKKKIKWDYKKIEEHNISRGTRMKINESKTPKNVITFPPPQVIED
jgi:hypothetical protein